MADVEQFIPDKPPEGLVYEEQSLRFHLRGTGLTEAKLAVDGLLESEFGVLVANEYGLWRKSDLPSIGRRLRVCLEGPGKDSALLELVHCDDENLLPDGSAAQRDNMLFLQLNGNAKMQCTVKVRLKGAPVVLNVELLEQGERRVESVCSMPIFMSPSCDGRETCEDEATALVLRNSPEARQGRAVGVPSATGEERLIFVAEAPAYLGIGGRIWDAAWETMRWLEQSEGDSPSRMQQWISGRDVLELGSGTGSMALALGNIAKPTSLTMTDLPDVVELLQFNVALNACLSSEMSCKFHCAALPWGDEAAAKALLGSGRMFSTLLLCDLIYMASSCPPLVQSLEILLPPEKREEQHALLAYRHRHEECKLLFELLDAEFEVVRLPSLPASDVQFFSIRRKQRAA
eukprot:TRINITY_DN20145_c0_g2_i4.p1 TRINITY_DN20145_c0_g2~~TRINITY_DN20145_c0_g2_i4.p1  ORF type:complete len:413 (-),score=80.87 TRINITY_DN20145_c0_g2_i4:22-1230(-)